MKLVKMRVGKNSSILVEVPEGAIRGAGSEICEKIDKAFDELVKKQIVDNCKTIISAFEEIKDLSIPPQKASAEFGMQFNGEGNIYIAKISSQANFKVSFEWDFIQNQNI